MVLAGGPSFKSSRTRWSRYRSLRSCPGLAGCGPVSSDAHSGTARVGGHVLDAGGAGRRLEPQPPPSRRERHDAVLERRACGGLQRPDRAGDGAVRRGKTNQEGEAARRAVRRAGCGGRPRASTASSSADAVLSAAWTATICMARVQYYVYARRQVNARRKHRHVVGDGPSAGLGGRTMVRRRRSAPGELVCRMGWWPGRRAISKPPALAADRPCRRRWPARLWWPCRRRRAGRPTTAPVAILQSGTPRWCSTCCRRARCSSSTMPAPITTIGVRTGSRDVLQAAVSELTSWGRLLAVASSGSDEGDPPSGYGGRGRGAKLDHRRSPLSPVRGVRVAGAAGAAVGLSISIQTSCAWR